MTRISIRFSQAMVALLLVAPALASAADNKPNPTGSTTASTGKGKYTKQETQVQATQTKLTKIVGTPIYKQLTIRNWNTTTKLVRLLESDTALVS